jgi:DNA-binding CsgD family transcriptional regulator
VDRRRHPADDGGDVVNDPIIEDGDGGTLRLALAALLGLVVVGGAVDLALDAPTNWRSAHVLFELTMVASSLAFGLYLWRGWRRASRSLAEVRHTLAERHAERDAWRASAQRALDGLGRAIDRQFALWRLTPVEREVALLLLKGYGHKQAAATTGRSERTVRQHAVSVYRKSGLAGRAELAAFFLQDLMLPAAQRPPTGAATDDSARSAATVP